MRRLASSISSKILSKVPLSILCNFILPQAPNLLLGDFIEAHRPRPESILMLASELRLSNVPFADLAEPKGAEK